MKIAIVGAGAAGLAALRYSLLEGHECVAFELTGKVGGTWNYSEYAEFDDNGFPVRSSMYQGLMTNLPKELMEYEDFHYDKKNKSYISQEEVLEYINKYASHFILLPFIKFYKHVLNIHPLPQQKWKIKVKDLKTNRMDDFVFDAVMICSGNYSVPKCPYMPGKENFEGSWIHSHFYRKPDPYENRKVLLIGAGPSGIDISRLISEVADKVYLSFNETLYKEKISKQVILKPRVTLFDKNSVSFEDGSEETVDDVIFCTGYRYSFPFLSEQCGIEVENNWVKYLYKHVINVKHPTMAFICVTFRICPFPTFCIQAKFFLAFLQGKFKVSAKEMMEDINKDMARRKKLGYPIYHAHKIGEDQGSYFDDLASIADIRKVPAVIQKMYRDAIRNSNPSSCYQIIDDNEFVKFTS